VTYVTLISLVITTGCATTQQFSADNKQPLLLVSGGITKGVKQTWPISKDLFSGAAEISAKQNQPGQPSGSGAVIGALLIFPFTALLDGMFGWRDYTVSDLTFDFPVVLQDQSGKAQGDIPYRVEDVSPPGNLSGNSLVGTAPLPNLPLGSMIANGSANGSGAGKTDQNGRLTISLRAPEATGPSFSTSLVLIFPEWRATFADTGDSIEYSPDHLLLSIQCTEGNCCLNEGKTKEDGEFILVVSTTRHLDQALVDKIAGARSDAEWVTRANKLIAEGEYRKVITEGNGKSRKDQNSDIQLAIGLAYYHLDNLEKCIRAYKEAAKISPSNIEAEVRLSNLNNEIRHAHPIEELIESLRLLAICTNKEKMLEAQMKGPDDIRAFAESEYIPVVNRFEAAMDYCVQLFGMPRAYMIVREAGYGYLLK
jgi:hypothetical protein